MCWMGPGLCRRGPCDSALAPFTTRLHCLELSVALVLSVCSRLAGAMSQCLVWQV